MSRLDLSEPLVEASFDRPNLDDEAIRSRLFELRDDLDRLVDSERAGLFFGKSRREQRGFVCVFGPGSIRDAVESRLGGEDGPFTIGAPGSIWKPGLHLGPRPLVRDSEYLSRWHLCLAEGCSHFLRRWPTEADAAARGAVRRNVLLDLLVAAVRALFPDSEGQARYFAYHRNWALRLQVQTLRRGPGKLREIYALYEREAEASRGSTLDRSRERLLGKADVPEALEAWTRALEALQQYLDPLAGDRRYDQDPFVAGPLGPVLFRVFRHLAVAADVSLVNEGLVHHLLYRSLSSDDAGPPALVPLSGVEEGLAEAESVYGFSFNRDHRWLDLIAAASPEGDSWARQYRAVGEPIRDLIREALSLLRCGDFEVAKRRLEVSEAELTTLEEDSSDPDRIAIACIVRRFHFGALAYLYFREGAPEAANDAFDRVSPLLSQAIEARPFLRPCATITQDIPLKRARLARDRNDWPGVESYLRKVHDMATDLEPLCLLADGEAIYQSSIAESLPADFEASEDLASTLRYLRDVGMRRRMLLEWFMAMYYPPGSWAA